MSNPHRKPGEDELGIFRVRKELSGDRSKKSDHGERTNDPVKRKSKEIESNTDLSEFEPNSNRVYSREFEDVQGRLSSNRARLDSIKKADSGYSDDFYANVGVIFKIGKEAKMGLKYIDKHRKLPPPTE